MTGVVRNVETMELDTKNKKTMFDCFLKVIDKYEKTGRSAADAIAMIQNELNNYPDAEFKPIANQAFQEFLTARFEGNLRRYCYEH